MAPYSSNGSSVMRITSGYRCISEKLEIEGIETLPGEQGL